MSPVLFGSSSTLKHTPGLHLFAEKSRAGTFRYSPPRSGSLAWPSQRSKPNRTSSSGKHENLQVQKQAHLRLAAYRCGHVSALHACCSIWIVDVEKALAAKKVNVHLRNGQGRWGITDAACMSTPYLSTSDDDVRSAQRAPMFDERRTSWVPREMVIGEVRENNAQSTAHMQFVER